MTSRVYSLLFVHMIFSCNILFGQHTHCCMSQYHYFGDEDKSFESCFLYTLYNTMASALPPFPSFMWMMIQQRLDNAGLNRKNVLKTFFWQWISMTTLGNVRVSYTTLVCQHSTYLKLCQTLEMRKIINGHGTSHRALYLTAQC